VRYIIRVWCSTEYGEMMTYMSLSPNDEAQRTRQGWHGDIKDEIWDLLQAGSDEHLGVHDKLRENVVL